MEKEVNEVGLSKYNGSEHSVFHLEVQMLVEKSGAEKVACTELLTSYAAAIEQHQQTMNQPRGSVHTAELEQLDKERDQLLSYLISSVDACKHSPIAGQADASTYIGHLLSPYKGITRRAVLQKSNDILTLVEALKEPTAVANLATLNLSGAVAPLEKANNDYIALDITRIEESPKKSENTEQRKLIDELYYSMVQKINATNALASTPDVEVLIFNINQRIEKSNALYNQRIAQKHRTDDQPEAEPSNTAEE